MICTGTACRRHLPERSERLPVCQVHHRRGTLPLYLVRATGPVWTLGMYGWTPALCGETGLHVQRTKILARQRTLPSGGLYVQLCGPAMENPADRTSHHGNGIPECTRRLVGQRRCGTEVGLVYFCLLRLLSGLPGLPLLCTGQPVFLQGHATLGKRQDFYPASRKHFQGKHLHTTSNLERETLYPKLHYA